MYFLDRFLNRGGNRKTDCLSRTQGKRVKEIEKEIIDVVFQTPGGVDRAKIIKKYAAQGEQGLEATALDLVLGYHYRKGGRDGDVADENGIIERQFDRKNERIMLCPRDDREVEWKTTGPIKLGAKVNSKGEWFLED